MTRLILRPFVWTFWLLLDTLLAMCIVSIGSRNFLLIPFVVAICLGLAMETQNVVYGLIVFAFFILIVMIDTRFDEDIRKELLKYRRQPQPLFGKRVR